MRSHTSQPVDAGRSFGYAQALSVFAMCALAWLPLYTLAAAENLPPADQFISMLRERNFPEAARAFYVPPTYLGEQLIEERASISHGLTFLFGAVGEIEAATRETAPEQAEWWFVGQSGGDRPYSPSEVGADGEVEVRYAVRVRTDPRAQIVLTYVHVSDGWKVLQFKFGIPRDDPGAEARWRALASKIYEAARQFHTIQNSRGT